MAGNPFQAVIEACEQAAQAYTPENAMRVIEWYDGMPELIEAFAGMLSSQGAQTVDEFYLYPAAGEFAQKLGDNFRRYSEPCEEARNAFESVHKDDLQRIRDPQRNQERWDIAANRE